MVEKLLQADGEVFGVAAMNEIMRFLITIPPYVATRGMTPLK